MMKRSRSQEVIEQDHYQNGSTQPPKNRGGTIATLFVAAIFLGGIISGMSLLNIHLFSPSDPADNATSPVGFHGNSAPPENAGREENPPLPTSEVEIPIYGAPVPGSDTPQSEALSLLEIYERNIPSVVSVTGTRDGASISSTGLVLSKNGYIVTSAGNIHQADSLQVLFSDGKQLSAVAVGTDSMSDLAVVYVDAKDLVPALLGDSADIRVGDNVSAIGDHMGTEFRCSITDGIISAIHREDRRIPLLQTTAIVSSVSSGGPLLNRHGQVIGIVTPMRDGGTEGLGFAVPSDAVKDIAQQIIRQGYVSGRPSLGLKGQWVSEFYQHFRHMPAGFCISEAPAGQKGIVPGDILVKADGVRITKPGELITVLSRKNINDSITLVLYRSGREHEITLTLQEDKG